MSDNKTSSLKVQFPQESQGNIVKCNQGRPSEFKPEFCDLVVNFMSQGYSLTAFAGSIGKSRECVYNWERTIPSFSDAVKAARAARIAKLESGLFQADGSQVTAHIFALKNACPAEWREINRTELTGADGDPLKVMRVMSDDELASIAAEAAVS